VHVNPSGDVTACPVSALATHNVRKSSLSEALASPLFAMIRENGHLLETEGHPCGLSAHAEELEKMARGWGHTAPARMRRHRIREKRCFRFCDFCDFVIVERWF